jgi:hypothetical protein
MYCLDLHSQTVSQASITQSRLTTCCLLARPAYSLILKMEVVCSSEMLVNFYLTTWRHIAEKMLFISSLHVELCLEIFLLSWWKILNYTLRNLNNSLVVQVYKCCDSRLANDKNTKGTIIRLLERYAKITNLRCTCKHCDRPWYARWGRSLNCVFSGQMHELYVISE